LKALPGLLPRSHAHDPPTRYFPRPPPDCRCPKLCASAIYFGALRPFPALFCSPGAEQRAAHALARLHAARLPPPRTQAARACFTAIFSGPSTYATTTAPCSRLPVGRLLWRTAFRSARGPATAPGLLPACCRPTAGPIAGLLPAFCRACLRPALVAGCSRSA